MTRLLCLAALLACVACGSKTPCTTANCTGCCDNSGPNVAGTAGACHN